MGITTKEIDIATCDICKAECGEADGNITIKVNDGDGRDVGPATINGKLVFNQPYGCQDGIVCRRCKLRFLFRYLESELSSVPCRTQN